MFSQILISREHMSCLRERNGTAQKWSSIYWTFLLYRPDRNVFLLVHWLKIISMWVKCRQTKKSWRSIAKKYLFFLFLALKNKLKNSKPNRSILSGLAGTVRDVVPFRSNFLKWRTAFNQYSQTFQKKQLTKKSFRWSPRLLGDHVVVHFSMHTFFIVNRTSKLDEPFPCS